MKGWLPETTWKLMLASMPIPCTDILCVNEKSQILLGWRIIPPYKNVWAVVGGVIRRGEHPEVAAKRHLRTYGIKVDALKPIGVFQNHCRLRHNISVAYLGTGATTPTKLDMEFSRFQWFDDPPKNMGGMYLKMIESWRKAT